MTIFTRFAAAVLVAGFIVAPGAGPAVAAEAAEAGSSYGLVIGGMT